VSCAGVMLNRSSFSYCAPLAALAEEQARFEQVRLEVNAALRAEYERSRAGNRFFLVDLACVDPALSSDGIHFLPQGYEEFARMIFRAMEAAWQ